MKIFIYAAFGNTEIYEGVISAPSAEIAMTKVKEFYEDKDGGEGDGNELNYRVVPFEQDHRYDEDYPCVLEMIEREVTE